MASKRRDKSSWLGFAARWGLLLLGVICLAEALLLLLQHADGLIPRQDFSREAAVIASTPKHSAATRPAHADLAIAEEGAGKDSFEGGDRVEDLESGVSTLEAEGVQNQGTSAVEADSVENQEPAGGGAVQEDSGCSVSLLEEFLPEKNDADKKAKRKGSLCNLGKTYGCASGSREMWAKAGCWGVFSVSGSATVCGGPGGKVQMCSPGRTQTARDSCGIVLVTTFFTDKKDWQRQKKMRPDFKKIQRLYRTALKNGLNVTVIYDDLPADLRHRYETTSFVFHQVNLCDFETRLGVNDVRYFFFERLVNENPSWRFVFVVDAFDVIVGMNPCSYLEKDRTNNGDALYVGVELDRLAGHPWMKARYDRMGGRYKKWFKGLADSSNNQILNCGITGGPRQAMLNFFDEMKAVISDPQLAVRASNAKAAEEHRKGEDIHVNMAALNYLAYNNKLGRLVSGEPVHSKYKHYQSHREDVWFVHK